MSASTRQTVQNQPLVGDLYGMLPGFLQNPIVLFAVGVGGLFLLLKVMSLI